MMNGWIHAPAARCASGLALAVAILAAGCTREMHDQPRVDALEGSDFFHDGKGTRLPVEGTVARGDIFVDDPFFSGKLNGRPVDGIPDDPRSDQPFKLTEGFLERGRDRFDAFCSHCHGRLGYGDGMVVRRGFRVPPSLHEPRLRDETPPGYFYDVISNGFRTMPAQRSRIAPADRWAVVAYIRVLQTSQHVPLDEAPADIREKFVARPRDHE